MRAPFYLAFLLLIAFSCQSETQVREFSPSSVYTDSLVQKVLTDPQTGVEMDLTKEIRWWFHFTNQPGVEPSVQLREALEKRGYKLKPVTESEGHFLLIAEKEEIRTKKEVLTEVKKLEELAFHSSGDTLVGFGFTHPED